MYNINQNLGPQTFTDVGYRLIRTDGSCTESKGGFVLETSLHGESYMMLLKDHDGKGIVQAIISKNTEGFKVGKLCFTLNIEPLPVVLLFSSTQDVERFETFYQLASRKPKKNSIFDERTEDASASQYFQFYGYLSQQQNMMQDYIRTSTYQRAILQNVVDFRDKVVLDVGAGTGILSFFAVQAGARKVYAVEASNMAQHAETIVQNNNLSDTIKVILGKIEEIEIPEQVDMIISEPMGYMLFNERMLETYVHSKKFLKAGGKMFPSKGDLHVAPFTDDALYMEHFGKSNFWAQTSFYGVDLTSLRQAAIQEYFRQPIVDTFDVKILMAKPCTHTVNFLTSREEDLHVIHIPLHYTMLMTGTLHGLAFWFDCAFLGSSNHVWLSTAPQEPLTHWYQVRCLLVNPVFVRAGQKVSGSVTLHANMRQSYYVEMEVSVDGTGVRSSNCLDLKNPYFRFTGVPTQPPPGNHNASPTDAYWGNASVVLNGGLLSSSSGAVLGGQQYTGGALGGGLFAYSSQAVGNVMATGTVGYSGISGQPVIAGVPQGNVGSDVLPSAVDTNVVSQAFRNVTIGNYQ